MIESLPPAEPFQKLTPAELFQQLTPAEQIAAQQLAMVYWQGWTYLEMLEAFKIAPEALSSLAMKGIIEVGDNTAFAHEYVTEHRTEYDHLKQERSQQPDMTLTRDQILLLNYYDLYQRIVDIDIPTTAYRLFDRAFFDYLNSSSAQKQT